MPVVAFLFTQDPPRANSLSDNRICEVLTRGLLSRSKHDEQVSAQIHSGGLLLHRFAYRTVEKSEVDTFKGRKSLARTEKAKLEAWAYLLAEFCESFEANWHLGSVISLEETLRTGGVEVYSVGHISLPMARMLDRKLRNVDGYLGAMEVDLGHLVQYKVCWSGLIRRYQVVGTELGFLTGNGTPPEEKWALNADPERWWHSVGASAVYWIEPGEPNKVHPDHVDRLPDSSRGAAARTAIARLMKPTPLERLVERVGPNELPPDTRSFSAERLPGAADAIIPPDKLTKYALNLDHEIGGPKARLFLELLDIAVDDWQFLAEQLLQGIQRAPAFGKVRRNDYGVQFDVITAVKGRNGVIKPVLSAWIVLPGQPPSLTTVFIPDRKTVIDTDSVEDVPILPLEKREDWELLWEVASAAAAEAAERAVPEPMFVRSGEDGPGRWYLGGAEGLAAVRVFDARRGFARWLRQSGHGRSAHLPGSWIFANYRNYDTSVAWASAFVEVLQWHDVRSEVFAVMT